VVDRFDLHAARLEKGERLLAAIVGKPESDAAVGADFAGTRDEADGETRLFHDAFSPEGMMGAEESHDPFQSIPSPSSVLPAEHCRLPSRGNRQKSTTCPRDLPGGRVRAPAQTDGAIRECPDAPVRARRAMQADAREDPESPLEGFTRR